MRFLLDRLAAIITIAAASGAVAWALKDLSNPEPLVTILALLGSLAALLIERRVAARERRRELLRALAFELYKNLQVINEPIFKGASASAKSYPRLYVSAIERLVCDGSFSEEKDHELWKLAHEFHGQALGFNNTLDIAEELTLRRGAPQNRPVITGSAAETKVRQELNKLALHLMERYQRETDIDKDTTLFGAPAKRQYWWTQLRNRPKTLARKQ